MSAKLERIRALCAARPGEPFAWYSLAMEEWKTEPSSAQATFARLLSEFPRYLPSYYQYGKLLAERGDPARAREVLRAGMALARETGDGHALSELSAALEQLP